MRQPAQPYERVIDPEPFSDASMKRMRFLERSAGGRQLSLLQQQVPELGDREREGLLVIELPQHRDSLVQQLAAARIVTSACALFAERLQAVARDKYIVRTARLVWRQWLHAFPSRRVAHVDVVVCDIDQGFRFACQVADFAVELRALHESLL